MSDVADPRRAAIELAAKNEAAWRALSPLSPWAAFYAVDNILKARRASSPGRIGSPLQGQPAMWRAGT